MPARRTTTPAATGPSVLDGCHGPVAEVDAVIAYWSTGTRPAGTATRIDELARRFAARLAATGIGSIRDAGSIDCEQFVWASTRRGKSPSLHTVHLRRTVLRAIYRTLHALDDTITDPTQHLGLPGKPAMATRPLTDSEIVQLRTTALSRTRRPWRAAAAVALAEATATTGELHQIRWDHLDLTEGSIMLPGADPIRPRTTTLTNWGRGVLTQHAPGVGHVIGRRVEFADGHVAQAAMSSLLARLLNEAGLRDDSVKPSSIRLWAGRQHLNADGIEAAARALGLDSLDRTATALDHRW